MLDSSLLSLASGAALLARAPTSDEFVGRVIQILGSTIFSVIIVWVVIKIWKGEFLAGDDEKQDKTDRE